MPQPHSNCPGKPPQTEEEEHYALIYEAGWLTAQFHEMTGRVPRAFADGVDFSGMTTEDVAALCQAIRDECPGLIFEKP